MSQKKRKIKISSNEESCQDDEETECINCCRLYSQYKKVEKCHQNCADVDDWKTFICEICFNGLVTAHKNGRALISDGIR
jgi:hypothetical protein